MSSTPMTLKKRLMTIVIGFVALGFMGNQVVNMIAQGSQKTQQQQQASVQRMETL